jgi:hypothetical protein
VLATAAAIHLVQRILDSGTKSYDAELSSDAAALGLIHFAAVHAMRHRTLPFGLVAPEGAAVRGRAGGVGGGGRDRAGSGASDGISRHNSGDSHRGGIGRTTSELDDGDI